MNYKNAQQVRRLPAFLLVAMTAFASIPNQLPGQSASPSAASGEDDEIVTLAEFAVTGSNIRRIEEETNLPVTVFDMTDLDLRAAPTPAELFDTLPIAGVTNLSEGEVLGADARGDNNALNLRGIGSGSTLVLINGRRMSPHPISQSEGGVPSLAINANQLPTAAIDRIEILRDGASAIYGADAAAGVVNTILLREFIGYEVSGRVGITENGGADDWRVGVAGGDKFNDGRTRFVFTADFYHRDKLRRKDRGFSRDSDGRRNSEVPPPPWDGIPLPVGTTTVRDNDFDNRSATSNYGNFVRGAFAADGNFVGARPDGSRGIVTSTTPSTTLTSSTGGVFFLVPIDAGGTGFRQTTPSRNFDSVESDYYYDLNIGRNLLPETDRFNFFGRMEHDITTNTTFFGEVGYYHAESETDRDPAGVDASDDNGINVGVDNPYNPFGSRFYEPTGAPNADGTPRVRGAPAAVLIQGSTGVRPREFPNKLIDVTSKAYRGVAGLRGKVRDGKWDWESAVLYSKSETRDVEHFNVRESRLKEALLRTDATAFNPFGYTFKAQPNGTSTTNPFVVQIDQPYTNPDSVVDPLYDDFVREGETEVASFDAKVSGHLFDLLGTPISFAAGGEYRYESYADTRPPFAGLNPPDSGLDPSDNDFIGLSPNLNLSSDRNVYSVYGELLVPIFGAHRRARLMHALELSLAGRFEDFSDFGNATKPKVSLAWRPNATVLLRGSYNESFRAPNLVQTNTQPLQRSVSGVTDPYRFDVTAAIQDGSVSRTVFRQGNSELVPEEADTVTFGVAVEVPFIKGLTVTGDYWRIKQSEVIDNLSATEQLSRDEVLLDAFTQSQIAAGANPNNIDTASGTAGYQGNTKVTRAPVTQADRDAFAMYNLTAALGDQRAPVGSVISVIDDYLNLASREIEGIDLGFTYRLPETSVGRFSLRGDATYLTKFDEQLEEGAEIETVLEEDGRAKWKWNLGATWRKNSWSAGWFTTYWGSSMDIGAATTEAVYEELGRPNYIRVFNDVGGVVRYRYVTRSWTSHNAYVNYRFGKERGMLSNLNLRVGVNNLFDEDPPINDDSAGYQQGTVNTRGRMYYTEFSKQF